MQRKRTLSLPHVGTLVVGLALGLLAGRWSNRSDNGVKLVEERPRLGARKVVRQKPAIAASPSHAGLDRFSELVKSGGRFNLREALGVIEQLDPTECREALKLIRTARNEDRAVLLKAIANRWASADLEGLFTVLREERGLMRDMESWQALAAAAAPELARNDPQGALQKIATISHPLPRLLLERSVLIELANQDPLTAASLLGERRERSRVDDDIFRAVGLALGRTSPQQGIIWAESLPNSRAKAEAVKAVWTGWAELDPASAAAELERRKGEKLGFYGAIARSWSKTDPSAAAAWIQSLSSPQQQQEAWRWFMPNTSEMDGAQAMKLIESIQIREQQERLAGEFALELGRKDRDAARQWIEQLPGGDLRYPALRPFLDEWAVSDPVGAVSYVTALPESSQRADLLRRAVATWGQQDTQAALNWTRQLPPGNERDEVAAEAARAAREYSPGAGMGWVELIQNRGSYDHTAQEVAGEWARVDGPAAAQWIGQLRNSEENLQAYNSVARQWALEDPLAAEKWVATLTPGKARDSAIQAFVASVDGYDAGIATRWAASIDQPEAREQTLRNAFQRWARSDREAAAAWLQQAQIPDETRAAMSAALGQNGQR
jgi:hypothetical protein